MAEPAPAGVAAQGPDEDDAPPRSYGDAVRAALGRRKLFRLGVALLALLYALAIYAPLIANGRPYVLEAVDLGGYRAALSSLSAVVAGIDRLVAQSEEQYRAELEAAGTLARAGVPQDRAGALERELGAALERTSTLRRYLPDELEGPLDDLARALGDGCAAFERGEPELADPHLEQAKLLARGLRQELAAWDPARPDEGGVHLVSVRSYPLWESLSWVEIFFMVLWAPLLAWPLWNPLVDRWLLRGDRARIGRWRRRKVGAVLGLAALAALAWGATIGGGLPGIDVAPFKAALTRGDLIPLAAGSRLDPSARPHPPVWAPVRYGVAETHTEATFRPPTWLAGAEIDEQGRYVRGARATGEGLGQVTPIEVRAAERARNDPWRRIAGTDELGRDFFTRMLWGGRVSLSVGILSALLSTLIGVAVGSIAGHFGGWIDALVLRVIEVLQSLPAFFLILMAMAFTDPAVVPPMLAIVVVIALIRWTGVARLVRGEFLRLRDQEFVLAARALGFSEWRILAHHVLPNALSPVLVAAAFEVAAGILTESAVSFLGFGSRPPEASWGSLVNASRNPTFWWIQVFPGLLIFLTVTCYNLVGDALRDALDPKMKA